MWTNFGKREVNQPSSDEDSCDVSHVSSLDWLNGLDANRDDYAARLLDRIFIEAIRRGASDIHFDADEQSTSVRLRINGTLVTAGSIPLGKSTTIINRLKALAQLITYRSDIPQEGRLQLHGGLEARVGTLPTLHGERAVVRLSTPSTKLLELESLGLPQSVLERTQAVLEAPSGVLMITGPAGAGKTTTAYACLNRLATETKSLQNNRSIVSLEDPIEWRVAGVAQSQINPSVGFDWTAGLKALLRQDSEVMLVGEIRDAATAATVFEAAMTGQLVITTMHARSVADAIRRLLDMGVAIHHLRSGLALLTCQRLLRKVCQCQNSKSVEAICPACGNSGYSGRLLLAEMLPEVTGELSQAITTDADAKQLLRAAQHLGMQSLEAQATVAVTTGLTTEAEQQRHFKL